MSASARAIFAWYTPPFDLLSDMLFTVAFCPTAPLQRCFPARPFLSLGGRTPLVMWFSRVRKVGYQHAGQPAHLGDGTGALYNELTVVALLRERGVFVPGIYATSDLTISIGHGYGMPKRDAAMRWELARSRLSSEVMVAGQQSFVRARLVSGGRVAGALAALAWPQRIWPARFPAGSTIRPLIQATPRVQLAHVRAGRLALDTPWLPAPVPLLPVGLYLPAQRMQLPPPADLTPSLIPPAGS